MWAKIALGKAGRSVGGWLIGSWSTGTAPYWIPRMHYYSREDRKFYFVRLNTTLAKLALNVEEEDILDANRANFILENIDTCERGTQPVDLERQIWQAFAASPAPSDTGL